MPLLWNMFVAIRIWIKLGRSIPPAFEKYYTLIPDPTAGKVTVVAQMPSLKMPGLWSTDPPNGRPARSPSEKQEPYSRVHASLLAMGMPLTAPSTGMMASDTTRNKHGSPPASISIERRHLLRRTWMSLVDHCGLVLNELQHDENGNDHDPSDEEGSRFMVAGDMKASDRTPLKMNWAQFVWLALALDASPYDPRWQSNYPCTLKSSENEDFIYLFYEEDRLFAKFVPRGTLTYSLPRAFGWRNIRFDDGCLLPLGYSGGVPQRLESVTISPELSACRLGMDLRPDGRSNTVSGKEPQDCTNGLAAASSWMLYCRRHRLELGELVPVSQHILEYRQRILCHLKLLDNQNKLVSNVQMFVLDNTVDDQITQLGPRFDAKLQTSGTSLPQPELSPGPSREADQGDTAKSDEAVKDVPPSTQNQSLVEAILEQLRSSFASSGYVQRHADVCTVAVGFGNKLEGRQTETEHLQQQWPRALSSRWSRNLRERWQIAMGKLDPQSSPHEHWQFGRRANFGSKTDLYALIPLRSRTELEHAVQSWEADSDGHDVSRWGECDGIGFLAFVALALADWDQYHFGEWRLQSSLQSMGDKVAASFTEGMYKGLIGHLFWNQLRDITTSVGILENGLYAAPSVNPVVTPLQLREKDSIVYLL
jgi:hypothetical protein